MRNRHSLGFLFATLLLLTGCAGSFPRPQIDAGQNNRTLAEAFVRQDWELFAGFQRQAFADRFSRDFLADRSVFLDQAEASFYRAVPLDLSFTVSSVFMKDGKLAVTIKWQRKMSDRQNGDLVLKEGSCLIVYRYEADQWRIYQIQGDSIFIF